MYSSLLSEVHELMVSVAVGGEEAWKCLICQKVELHQTIQQKLHKSSEIIFFLNNIFTPQGKYFGSNFILFLNFSYGPVVDTYAVFSYFVFVKFIL